MSRVLVTGGSGFLGTNLVDHFLTQGIEVLSLDIWPPQCPSHRRVYRQADLLDGDGLRAAVRDFAPTQVLHLAARTDLAPRGGLSGYDANIAGVRNLVAALAGQPSVHRAIFASTKLVCPTDAKVADTDDYRPDTLYGQSKVLGERIVKSSTELQCPWCIVRPTSIWGPWCEVPYGRFFRMVARGCYWHPGRADPPKSFGYVGNVVFQIAKLLAAPPEQIHRQVFYLSDYEPLTIRRWADTISLKTRNRKVGTLPEPIVRLLARLGDAMQLCGVDSFPLTSFRLRNMRADTTGIPLEPIRRITGPLPFSMEQGVERTLDWLQGPGNRCDLPRRHQGPTGQHRQMAGAGRPSRQPETVRLDPGRG